MKIVASLLAALTMFAVFSSTSFCQEHRLPAASPTMGLGTDRIEVSAEIIEIDNSKLKAAGIELYSAMKSATAKHIDSLKIADFVDRLEADSAAQRLFTARMEAKSGQESYTRHDDHLLEVKSLPSTDKPVMQVNVKSLNHQVERTFEITLSHAADQSLVVNPSWPSLKSNEDKTYCLLFAVSDSAKKTTKATTVSKQRILADRYDVSAKYYAVDHAALRKMGVDYISEDHSSTPKAINGLSLRSYMILLERHSAAKKTFFPLVSVDPNQVAYTHLIEQGGALDCHFQSIVNQDASSIDVTVTRKTAEAGKSPKSVTYMLDASTNKTYSLDVTQIFDKVSSRDIEHTIVVSLDCVSNTNTH